MNLFKVIKSLFTKKEKPVIKTTVIHNDDTWREFHENRQYSNTSEYNTHPVPQMAGFHVKKESPTQQKIVAPTHETYHSRHEEPDDLVTGLIVGSAINSMFNSSSSTDYGSSSSSDSDSSSGSDWSGGGGDFSGGGASGDF